MRRRGSGVRPEARLEEGVVAEEREGEPGGKAGWEGVALRQSVRGSIEGSI